MTPASIKQAPAKQGITVKAYLISLAVGALVGVIYGLLRVKSPAPPTVALVGLFGMLAGEQLIALIRAMLR
jgi:XapX domain-containing protein